MNRESEEKEKEGTKWMESQEMQETRRTEPKRRRPKRDNDKTTLDSHPHHAQPVPMDSLKRFEESYHIAESFVAQSGGTNCRRTKCGLGG